jgi:hypothetical protein
MSDDSIPAPDDRYKHDIVFFGEAKRVVFFGEAKRVDPENILVPLGIRRRALRAANEPSPTPAAKRGRRRPERKSGLWLVLHAAQEHGITHPTVGGFLQLPREFDAILALEPKPIAQVVLEVLRQTIGTVVYDQHGHAEHRQWASISQRHFARAGLMSNKDAWQGIEGALQRGYIVRRAVGKRRFEYAIRWKGTN